MIIGLDDVIAAAGRLRGVVNETPVLHSRTLDHSCGATVYVKAENFQKGGAFKFRGAYNKIAALPRGAKGVATYSSGNHAQAVAIAAGICGTTAVILMPEDVPQSKLEATRSYGAEVVLYDRYREDREVLGLRLAQERALELVPPYDDPLVMAGQGTATLELIEEVGHLDVLVVPVGGGGLIAGSATAAKGRLGDIRVIGVEPEAGDDTRRSLKSGARVTIPVPRTIADGLQASAPGKLTLRVNARLVDDIVVVTDDETVAAMAFLFERMKVVSEPSGAVGMAALLSGKVDVGGRRVGVILSGGNVSAQRFCALVSKDATAS